MDAQRASPGPAGRPDRLYALDNLRALMMWLGIVLHVAAIYMTRDSPLPWRDDASTPLADVLTAFIHAFRMPVFFILAGFFVAMLVQKRGVRDMVRNRLRRLGLPFAVFWPPLFAACVVFALLFVHRMARGTWGLDRTLMPVAPNVPTGPATMHLWFLWMLLWFCVLTAPVLWLAARVPADWLGAVAVAFARLGGSAWGFVVLALPLAFVGAPYFNGVVVPSGSFLPPPAEWVHNGLFYVFGWYLWRHQQVLFALYTRRWLRLALMGLVLFMATGALVEWQRRAQAPAHLTFWIAFVYNGASWLWSFALIGLFLRYLQRPHAVLGYLADSSYWVYLLHMPLTIGFGALLFVMPWPALVKMGVNLTATTVVCLVSYHLFVRFTGVSSLLNGKRHARRLSVSAAG